MMTLECQKHSQNAFNSPKNLTVLRIFNRPLNSLFSLYSPISSSFPKNDRNRRGKRQSILFPPSYCHYHRHHRHNFDTFRSCWFQVEDHFLTADTLGYFSSFLCQRIKWISSSFTILTEVHGTLLKNAFLVVAVSIPRFLDLSLFGLFPYSRFFRLICNLKVRVIL